MNQKITRREKAISPIIATLLLILIAIAAGVVVYAYVLGFVGSNTSGTGVAQAQMSIDSAVVAHGTAGPGASVQAIAVYLRNIGTTQATFGTGTFGSVKGQTDSVFSALALGAQIALTVGSTSTTFTSLSVAYVSANTVMFTIAPAPASGDTITVSFMGASCNIVSSGTTCTTSAISGVTFNSGWAASSGTISDAITSANVKALVTITPSAGSFTLPPGNVVQLTMAPTAPGGITLTQNNQYSVQVVAADGSSTSSTLKAS